MKSFFIFVSIIFSLTGYCNIDSVDHKSNFWKKPGHVAEISASTARNNNGKIINYRIESSYRVPVFKKAMVGMNIGYTNRKEEDFWRWRKNDFYLGAFYRYNFYRQPSTPFIGFLFEVDYSAEYKNRYYKVFNNKWNWGSTYLFDFGYTYLITNTQWGIDASYSFGLTYQKDDYAIVSHYSNNSVVSNKSYQITYFGFLRLGINYHF